MTKQEALEHLATPGGRLQAARIWAGYGSIEAACIAHGFKLQAMKRHESDLTAYYARSALPYAEALQVNHYWLMVGLPAEAPRWARPTASHFAID